MDDISSEEPADDEEEAAPLIATKHKEPKAAKHKHGKVEHEAPPITDKLSITP